MDLEECDRLVAPSTELLRCHSRRHNYEDQQEMRSGRGRKQILASHRAPLQFEMPKSSPATVSFKRNIAWCKMKLKINTNTYMKVYTLFSSVTWPSNLAECTTVNGWCESNSILKFCFTSARLRPAPEWSLDLLHLTLV